MISLTSHASLYRSPFKATVKKTLLRMEPTQKFGADRPLENPILSSPTNSFPEQRKQMHPLPLRSSLGLRSPVDITERQTDFSPENRYIIEELMEPYQYGKNLKRLLTSDVGFYNYQNKIVLVNVDSYSQSDIRPIGTCGNLTTTLIKALEEKFPKEQFHFSVVKGQSADYFCRTEYDHVFILGWTEKNHEAMTQFLKGLSTPCGIPSKALLIDPSLKMIGSSSGISKARRYLITDSSDYRYVFPCPFEKTFKFHPAEQSISIPLGFVKDLLPKIDSRFNLDSRFKDCLCYLSIFKPTPNQNAMNVDIRLLNPNGQFKSAWETNEFNRLYLDKIPSLKKLLEKAQSGVNLPESEIPYKNLFDRAFRVYQSNLDTLNVTLGLGHTPSFKDTISDIRDDRLLLFKGVNRTSVPPLEWDDSALMHNGGRDYRGLRESLKTSQDAKNHLRKLKTP